MCKMMKRLMDGRPTISMSTSQNIPLSPNQNILTFQPQVETSEGGRARAMSTKCL